MYFLYGEEETEYLKSKDKALGDAIEKIGHIERQVRPDIYTSLINSIVGQQISTAAHVTIWKRFEDYYGDITPEKIAGTSREDIQKFGTTYKKVDYILDITEQVLDGRLDIEALQDMDDKAVIDRLSQLKGIGVWTAEMLLTFSMQRPDVVSFGDLAILRGMRMLYRHRSIDRKLFNKYARRYSPYGTVASLYLWAIAGGAIPGLTDPAPSAKKAENRKKKTVKK